VILALRFLTVSQLVTREVFILDLSLI